MPGVEYRTPSLIGGVSQQSPSIRTQGQLTEQVNAYSSPVEGLMKRHPTEHVALLSSGAASPTKIHTVNRDQDEQYEVLLTATGITAFDVDGNSIFVLDETGGFGYLGSATNPRRDLEVSTNNDFTFIVNRRAVPAMLGTTTPTPPNAGEAFVFVRQGNYKVNYSVTIKTPSMGSAQTFVTDTFDGTTAVGSEISSIKTDDIAADLESKINTAAIGVTVLRMGSVLSIENSTDFEVFECTDSVGDSVLTGIHNTVPQVEGYLPTICRAGYKVKVVGNGDSTADDYFVEFVADAGAGSFGNGYWQESTGYGVVTSIDPSTMPHSLVRLFDDGAGTVTGTPNAPYLAFRTISWEPRVTGDEALVPDPSFIGRPIQDLFFFRDRMVLLAEDQVSMSESGIYFNFFRTTVRELLDSAPIHVGVAYDRVSLLHHGVPHENQLILFSDFTEFVLNSGQDILTPRTVQITPVLQFENYRHLQPIHTGRSVFFGFQREGYSGVREMYQLGDENTFDAEEITQQIPAYIPGEIEKLSGSTLMNVMVCMASGDPDGLYIYKYHWTGNQKQMSSWFRYEFNGATILDVEWIEKTLFLVVQRDEGVFLEKMVFGPRVVDPGKDFLTLIDRRVERSDCTVVYDPVTDETLITLPYDRSGDDITCSNKDGLEIPVIDLPSQNEVVLDGNVTEDFWIGEPYYKEVTLTPPLVYEETGRGTASVNVGERRVRKGHISFQRSRYFEVSVQVKYRQEYTYRHTGMEVSFPDTQLDSILIEDGVMPFSVMGRPEECTIKIKSGSHLPCHLTGIEWESMYQPRGQRFRG